MPKCCPRTPIVRSISMRSISMRSIIIALGAILGATFLLSWQTAPAYAQTIQVSATCLITDAVRSANSGSAQGGCAIDGTGSSYTVVLEPSRTYTLTSPEDVSIGNSAFVAITNTVTIEGNNAIIQRDPALICPSATDFRHFHILSSGQLTLANVTLENGCQPNGGSIRNTGHVWLEGATVRNNEANSIAGAIINTLGGQLYVTNSQIVSNTSFTTAGINNVGAGTRVFVRDNSLIAYNSGGDNGGGLSNIDGGHAVVENSRIYSNTAVNGAGIFNAGNSATITVTQGSLIEGNVALNGGGGIRNRGAGTLILEDSSILNNRAEVGAGIYNGAANASSYVTILGNSHIAGNEAGQMGGGLQMGGSRQINVPGYIHIENSAVYDNRAPLGGGLSITGTNSLLTITDGSQIYNNAADADGGGLYAVNGTLSISDTNFYSNTASTRGGGLHLGGSTTATIHDVHITTNSAGTGGGVQIADSALVAVTDARLLNNSTALAQSNSAQTTLSNSCIVGNGGTAVSNTGSTTLDAANNWWGELNGPGGAGPGSGDTISAAVTFTPLLAGPPFEECPVLRETDVQISLSALPDTPLLPGEPVTYQMIITNTGPQIAVDTLITASLSSLVTEVEATTSAGLTSVGPLAWNAGDLAGAEVRHVTLTGRISPSLSLEGATATTITTTAAARSGVYDPNVADNTASASQTVQLPHVHLGEAAYTQDEDAGPIEIQVLLEHANPFASTTVAYSTGEDTAREEVDYTPASGQLTFEPGSTEASFSVSPVANNEIRGERTLNLALSAPAGATLGSPFTATLTLLDNDTAGLDASLGVDRTNAEPGDVLQYSLRITNTGTTNIGGLTAEDSLTGVLALDTTSIGPGASAVVAQWSYTVMAEDAPGQLESTVDVAGTAPVDTPVSAQATVMATIAQVEEPTVPDTTIFIPALGRD